jgi:hypothetical protein
MKYFYQFVCFYSLILKNVYGYSFNCRLPEKCRTQTVYQTQVFDINENFGKKVFAIMCDIKDDSFEFKVNSETPIISGDYCQFSGDLTNYDVYDEFINI